MKYILVVASLLFAWGVNALAIEVSFSVGDVSITRGAEKITKIDAGTKLKANDVVNTGKKSFATVVYSDGSEISMAESSSLKIGKLVEGSDSAPIIVLAGAVTTKFAKLSKSDSKKVYTPTTVAAVRGTQFTVIVSDSAASRVELTEGSLDVHNPYGGQQIQAGTNMDVSVASAPQEGDKARKNPDEWKSQQDSEFDADVPERSGKFKTYLNDFSSRGSESKNKIDGLKKDLSGKKDKESLDKTGQELEKTNQSVEDDFYLGDASGTAIERLANKFANDKKNIRDAFQKLKQESNKVKEQQRRNYEAIQAVRESYKKAYDEIMGKQQENRRKILEGVDLNKVKPKPDNK
jgi:hypothetical protein